MKLFAPDYYESFSCIAQRCHHSCCIGWEINIDPQSLQRYESLSGEWGERLKRSICREGDTAYFRLGEGERCPFLNADGLCELILHFGEDSLCQICTDHPRFRYFFSSRTEIGLGLCCEEACRLALSQPQPVRLIQIGQAAGEEDCPAEESAFFTWRDQILRCAQDRSFPIEERVQQIGQMAGFDLSGLSMESWIPFMENLERMDESWADCLKRLDEETKVLDSQWDVPLEQLLVYLLYRHLSTGFEEDDCRGYLAFGLLMWHMIRQMFSGETMEELADLVRLYSSEIEYSDENIGKIIEELYGRIL